MNFRYTYSLTFLSVKYRKTQQTAKPENRSSFYNKSNSDILLTRKVLALNHPPNQTLCQPDSNQRSIVKTKISYLFHLASSYGKMKMIFIHSVEEDRGQYSLFCHVYSVPMQFLMFWNRCTDFQERWRFKVICLIRPV